MFIGHYAPAFAAATSPKSPRLSALFVAAQLVDVAFFSFLILDRRSVVVSHRRAGKTD
jgi:hypothetical protein